MTTPEKRRFPRVPLAVPVRIEIETESYPGETRNISVAGLLVKSERTFEQNQSLLVEFTLPGDVAEIHAEGTVQHVSPGAFMGIRFDALSEQHRDRIESYVNRSSVAPSGAEKRQHNRIPFVAHIEVQTGGFPFIAVAENLSVGGLLIRTANPAPQGQNLHLKFTLPGSDREIRVNGVVQHITPDVAMGVRFLDLDPADLEVITDFVGSA